MYSQLENIENEQRTTEYTEKNTTNAFDEMI